MKKARRLLIHLLKPKNCTMDKAKKLLDYEPKVNLEEGLFGLLDWVKNQNAADHVGVATEEFAMRQLV